MAERDFIRNVVAQNVKKYRKQNNMTQEKLAESADISNTYVANIECGKTWVSDKTLEKISSALGTDVYLFFIEPKTRERADACDLELEENLKRIDEAEKKMRECIREFFDAEKRRLVSMAKARR